MPSIAHEASVSLATSGTSAATARGLVRLLLPAWALEPLVEDAELVVTELVSNAVMHATGGLRLTLAVTEGDLQVELQDDSPKLPVPRQPGPHDEQGRGLVLVDALAGAWGVRRDGAGKTVWVTLDGPALPKQSGRGEGRRELRELDPPLSHGLRTPGRNASSRATPNGG